MEEKMALFEFLKYYSVPINDEGKSN